MYRDIFKFEMPVYLILSSIIGSFESIPLEIYL